MDEESVNMTSREEALARFRESLSKPLSERYFDEDELIDFFDYAGDLNDDYLRFEVLQCAARFYPDSEPLLQRKAIYHSQYSDESRMKCMEDNAEATGMIWDMMRARCANPSDIKERKAILDQILKSYTEYNDEEVIQLVDLASTFDCLDWLKDNLSLLRKKVIYVNVLLYEVAIAADSYQDYSFAISLLEELTELEPYNAGFWLHLARNYAAVDEDEKALNAIDYSLAIEPKDIGALYVKARLLYLNDAPREEVDVVLDQIIAIDDSLVDAIKMRASIMAVNGDRDGAIKFITDYIGKYPQASVSIVPEILDYMPDNINELLDKFYSECGEHSQMMWSAWAQHLMDTGKFSAAQAVLEAFSRNSGEHLTALISIENLFVQKKFAAAIEAISRNLKNGELSSIEDYPSLVIMHLVSMIRLGEFGKAFAFCMLLESKINKFSIGSISQHLEYEGLIKIVRQIKNKLKRTKDPADWVNFDPLGIFKD